ncbi:hypothetical protein FE576_23535, partial [Clostridioides difficile]|nr:hypothetical protein [Clostridioides difficile]
KTEAKLSSRGKLNTITEFGVKEMGVPLPIIIMIAMMMLMFGVSVIIIMKKKNNIFTQTIDPKPEQHTSQQKEEQR